MDKSINFSIYLCLSVLLSCYLINNSSTFVFEIQEPSIEKKFIINLKKRYYFQEMHIVENTLNDTCKIGLMKIPPKKIGKLYRIEFLSDSFPPYYYYPYKATTGKLKFRHIFSN
jgi:hypothetical protein